MFQVELVWNRSFNFVPHGPQRKTVEDAIKYAKALENMGDGASVKKTQIVDAEGEIVWQYGKLTKRGVEAVQETRIIDCLKAGGSLWNSAGAKTGFLCPVEGKISKVSRSVLDDMERRGILTSSSEGGMSSDTYWTLKEN